jgi:hypothetical protein
MGKKLKAGVVLSSSGAEGAAGDVFEDADPRTVLHDLRSATTWARDRVDYLKTEVCRFDGAYYMNMVNDKIGKLQLLGDDNPISLSVNSVMTAFAHCRDQTFGVMRIVWKQVCELSDMLTQPMVRVARMNIAAAGRSNGCEKLLRELADRIAKLEGQIAAQAIQVAELDARVGDRGGSCVDVHDTVARVEATRSCASDGVTPTTSPRLTPEYWKPPRVEIATRFASSSTDAPSSKFMSLVTSRRKGSRYVRRPKSVPVLAVHVSSYVEPPSLTVKELRKESPRRFVSVRAPWFGQERCSMWSKAYDGVDGLLNEQSLILQHGGIYDLSLAGPAGNSWYETRGGFQISSYPVVCIDEASCLFQLTETDVRPGKATHVPEFATELRESGVFRLLCLEPLANLRATCGNVASDSIAGDVCRGVASAPKPGDQ